MFLEGSVSHPVHRGGSPSSPRTETPLPDRDLPPRQGPPWTETPPLELTSSGGHCNGMMLQLVNSCHGW